MGQVRGEGAASKIQGLGRDSSGLKRWPAGFDNPCMGIPVLTPTTGYFALAGGTANALRVGFRERRLAGEQGVEFSLRASGRPIGGAFAAGAVLGAAVGVAGQTTIREGGRSFFQRTADLGKRLMGRSSSQTSGGTSGLSKGDQDLLRALGATEEDLPKATEYLTRTGQIAVEDPKAAIRKVIGAFQEVASDLPHEVLPVPEATSQILDDLRTLGHIPGENSTIDDFVSEITAALMDRASVSMDELANILKKFI